MPTLQETTTVFAGKKCVNPRGLNLHGQYSTLVHERANSYRCPSNFAYGQGWCLLTGEDARYISVGGSYGFRMTCGSEYFVLQRAYVLRKIVVSPGASHDSQTVLIEFVDRRYFLSRFTSCTSQYNVRCPGTQTGTTTLENYYLDTLDTENSDKWSWASIIYDLLDQLGIDYTPAFSVEDLPTSVPENIMFRGVRTWEALATVFAMCGLTLLYLPGNDSYYIMPQSESLAPDVDGLAPRLRFDYSVEETNGAYIPEAFDVIFRRVELYTGIEPEMDRSDNPARAWTPNGIHVERITTASLTIGNITSISGTVEPLHSEVPFFVKPDGTAAGSVLAAANSLVQGVVRSRLGGNSKKQIYSGLPITRPYPTYKMVIWRDYGDNYGMVTELVNHHGDSGQQEECLSQLTRAGSGGGGSPWGWSAMSSFGGLTGGMAPFVSPSREFAQPPDFARHTQPSYPRGHSIVGFEYDPEEYDKPQSQTSNINSGTDPLVPGKIYLLDPSDQEALVWNATYHDRMTGQDCYILFVSPDGGFQVKQQHPLGQTFFAKLQGVAADNKPIFVVTYQYVFMSGYIKEGEIISQGGAGYCIGTDGREYLVSGRFVPAGKQFYSPSPDSIYVGWIADPLDYGSGEYWKCIVADQCPTEAA